MNDKRVILCVDDDREVLDSLVRDLYPRYGEAFDIETCESAEEADVLRSELLMNNVKIDVYIVDHRMPGKKGIEFLKGVEKESGKILLTAYADIEVAVDGINQKCIDFYMHKPYGKELFKNLDHLLLAKDKGVFVTLARTPEERQKALITQNTVFSEEHLGLPYEAGIKIIGENPYQDITDMYVAVYKREIIGTTSLSRKNSDFAERFNTIRGLPIEEFYNINSIASLDENLVQVRNATVLPEFHTMRIGPMIWAELYRELTRKEPTSDYAVILAASEIKDAKKAAVLYEKIKNNGLYDGDHIIDLNKPNEMLYTGPITSEDLRYTVMPRVLKLYGKLGFRFIGEPVYYSNYQMFDFPMVLKISETAEPFKAWFEEGVL
jgi:response regulator RpfG family c-di-GMP phosphodiesterase